MPTEHKSFSVGNIEFVEHFFPEIDLDSIISPIKNRGVESTPLTKALCAYKLQNNFSIHNAYE